MKDENYLILPHSITNLINIIYYYVKGENITSKVNERKEVRRWKREEE